MEDKLAPDRFGSPFEGIATDGKEREGIAKLTDGALRPVGTETAGMLKLGMERDGIWRLTAGRVGIDSAGREGLIVAPARPTPIEAPGMVMAPREGVGIETVGRETAGRERLCTVRYFNRLAGSCEMSARGALVKPEGKLGSVTVAVGTQMESRGTTGAAEARAANMVMAMVLGGDMIAEDRDGSEDSQRVERRRSS